MICCYCLDAPPPNKRRRTQEDLEKLINIEAMEGGGYKCLLCHYSNCSLENVRSHMRVHQAGKTPEQCSLCNFEATSSEQLQEHMMEHCKTRSYHCKLCSATFKHKSQMRAHMCAHKEEAAPLLLCSKCEFHTKDAALFREHRAFHLAHAQEQTTSAMAEVTSDHVMQSTVPASADEAPTTVAATETTTTTSSKKTGARSYRCDLCSFVAHTQAVLKSHMKAHEMESSLRCESCGFEANSVRSLKSHMKRHVNDQRFVQQPLEQYKCNLCGYVCHHLPSLKSHMWRHANDKNYNYEQINAIINRALNYTETGDETDGDGTRAPASSDNYLILFRCCQCGYESVNKGLLNVHMKTHSDIIRKTLEVNENRLVHTSKKAWQEVKPDN